MKKKTGCQVRLFLCLVFFLLTISGCQGEKGYAYRTEGIEALENGDYELALERFDLALAADRGFVGSFDIDVLKYKAEAQLKSGDLQAAEAICGILLEVDSERPEYYNLRTFLRAEAGNTAGALEDFEQSSKLDKKGQAKGRLEALLSLGTALEKAGDKESALAFYENALKAGEGGAELYNRKGLIKIGQKEWDEALQAFTEGLLAEEADQVPELLFNQAVVFEYQGEFEKALELMEQYVSVCGPEEDAMREITFLKTRQIGRFDGRTD